MDFVCVPNHAAIASARNRHRTFADTPTSFYKFLCAPMACTHSYLRASSKLMDCSMVSTSPPTSLRALMNSVGVLVTSSATPSA